MKELIELIKSMIELQLVNKTIGEILLIYITVGTIVFTLLAASWKGVIVFIGFLKKRQLNKDLHPYYTYGDVERAIQYYIPTLYQNVSPSIDDEPGRNYIASAKKELIPLFIDEVFALSTTSNNFYLILADSGMGKTTFMINLFISYKNKMYFKWIRKKYDIILMPLGAKDVLDKLKSMTDEQKSNTIILLDAFDEDVLALEDYEKRMEEILSVVWKFRVVVVSCRTQFFSTEFEEPEKTKYMSFGESGRFRFQKVYLSAFDLKAIKQYLNKKYSIFKWAKKKKAEKIVEKCPHLMVRPMLLSHIGDLVESNKNFEFAYQLYEELIDRWIIRESLKPGIVDKYGSEERYRKILYTFSQNLAIDLYKNRKERGGYFISNKEKFIGSNEMTLSDFEIGEEMTEREKKGKSLLNRDTDGNYKFSHKSILEYFIAKHLFEDVMMYSKFDFNGMDMVAMFLNELAFFYLRKYITPQVKSVEDLFLKISKNSFTLKLDAGLKDDKGSIFTLDRIYYFCLFLGSEHFEFISYNYPLFLLETYVIVKKDGDWRRLTRKLNELSFLNISAYLEYLRLLSREENWMFSNGYYLSNPMHAELTDLHFRVNYPQEKESNFIKDYKQKYNTFIQLSDSQKNIKFEVNLKMNGLEIVTLNDNYNSAVITKFADLGLLDYNLLAKLASIYELDNLNKCLANHPYIIRDSQIYISKV